MILAADNIRITKKTVRQAVEEKDPKPIRALARRCEAAGAEAIDVNSGPLTREPEERMAFFVRAVQDATDLPILLDTANPRAMEGGLRASRKRAILNGLSLEPAKLREVLPLAKSYDVDVVGYILRPDGQVPADAHERLSIALELYQACLKAGVSKERLIIDPVVAPITWNEGVFRNQELLSVIRTLPEVLGFPVRTIAGLSNLTAGAVDKEKKQALETAFLPMMAASGLSMALLDIFDRRLVQAAKACRLLTGNRPFAWGEMD